MDVYALTLAAAVAAAVLAGIAAFIPKLRAAVPWLSGGSLALVLVSGVSHVFFGHAPGTASAMGVAAYFSNHPAFLVISAAAVAAGVVSRLRGREKG